MRRLLACATFIGSLFAANLRADPPPGYYDSATGLSGLALKNSLHNIISGHTVIPYADLISPLRDLWEDPNNSANLIEIYGGASVSKTAQTWNREHLWPRSRGVSDTGPDTSDLFHITPSDDGVNSTRGNLYFDNSSALDGGIISPAHPDAPLCTRDSNSWEPPANEKGDIARALFYMAVRYDGSESLTTDLELTNGSPSNSLMARLDTLVQWHLSDPPSTAERARNDRIYTTYQHNRNPFIDHPEWVTAIFGGSTGQLSVQALATDGTASESPQTTGTITIQLSAPAPTGGVTVTFALSGTADPGEYDLTGPGLNRVTGAATGTIAFAAGASVASITLTPLDDGLAEPTETTVLTISSSAAYAVAGTPATITIADSSAPPPSGVIASWAFDQSTFPVSHPADAGSASLDASGWTGVISVFGGVTGNAYCPASSAGNGSHLDFLCSTVGWRDITVDFQTRGSGTGFSQGTWSWSTNGTTFTQVPGVNTATQNTAFAARTVDFSAFAALNNASTVVLRYTLSGATSTNGNNRIDDFSIRGTPLPRMSIAASDATGAETGSDPLAFQLTSDAPAPSGGFAVTISLSGVALPGVDYDITDAEDFDSDGATAVVRIPSGSTGVTFHVTPLPDTNPVEFSESVIATVVASAGATFAPGSPSSANGSITDATPYNQAWAARFPALTPALAAPEADPDGDGLTNLAEFGLDANPLQSEPNAAPVLGKASFADPNAGGSMQQFATFTFTRRIDDHAPTYTPRSSSDLVTWQNNLVFVGTSPGPTAATERATYRSAIAITGPAAATQVFLRLQLSSGN